MNVINNDLKLQLKNIKNYINKKYHIYLENNKIIILDQIPSTNDYLLKCANNTNHQLIFCIAEQQTAGKGQFDRVWFSPNNNIYLSLLWRFNCNLKELTKLSQQIAITLNNTLNKYGILGSIIKWPNDILYNNRKLAGILIETIGKPNNNYCYAVIGVGLNVNLPKKLPLDSGLSLTKIIDIAEIIKQTPDRNKLTGMLIEGLLETVLKY